MCSLGGKCHLVFSDSYGGRKNLEGFAFLRLSFSRHEQSLNLSEDHGNFI